MRGHGEAHQKYIYLDYIERKVPAHISRFEYPWRLFRPVSTHLPLHKSNNRMIYSTTISDIKAAGLGHALLIINAEVQLARRLNISYTHRISKYPLSKPCQYSPLELCSPFDHVGAVEQLFGWGAGEISRSQVQLSICPNRIWDESSDECPICNLSANSERKVNNRVHKSSEGSDLQNEIKKLIFVNRTAEIPVGLSFDHSHELPMNHEVLLENFIGSHNHPNTAFLTPPIRCRRLSIKYIHKLEERSYFFYKYWNAHGYFAQKMDDDVKRMTFKEFLWRATKRKTIGILGKRPKLNAVYKDAINIAVHARRGDFFTVKRRMVPLKSFAYVIRQIIGRVIIPSNRLSKKLISITFYSEGRITTKEKFAVHDPNMMTKEFLDTDGRVLTESLAEQMVRYSNDSLGNIIKNNVNIRFSISENAIQSVHEMIAADIFIGSGSSLSTSAVGSISRAAFLLLPGKYGNENGTTLLYDAHRQIKMNEDNGRILIFQGTSGKIRENEIETMKILWDRFVAMHEHSFGA